ncbi:monovalent cation/H(+) antiporter subunit G [Peribacillus frigoritolerans]|uniref:monovalent cation/H(+) antiporter subunit G n=1 Tax=Peribacillus frigoritolerans TaxID=450367 RepID=UPI0022832835|nr:monovalent cation/H(+) antiporter subunit G [Peribacillus frigoritolerans]MCY9005493.1 monovalent cation/H(+) antiporter subunit G [Peribacillus frigoritolerans]MED4632003.1 monovalent cation/H(+) antiporter subunit G [Peribacillus frigoritolerans]
MTAIVEILSALFLLMGVFLFLVSAFGIIRLPDVYTRNHAASKSSTLGIMFILIGTLLYFYYRHSHFDFRVVLAIIFIFMTSPVAGHLIMRSAYHTGVKMWDRSVQDDLKKTR